MNQPTNPPAFKPGDVVMMKSGNGPHMTVETTRMRSDVPNLVNVMWFDRNARLRRDVIDDSNLKLVKPYP